MYFNYFIFLSGIGGLDKSNAVVWYTNSWSFWSLSTDITCISNNGSVDKTLVFGGLHVGGDNNITDDTHVRGSDRNTYRQRYQHKVTWGSRWPLSTLGTSITLQCEITWYTISCVWDYMIHGITWYHMIHEIPWYIRSHDTQDHMIHTIQCSSTNTSKSIFYTYSCSIETRRSIVTISSWGSLKQAHTRKNAV